MKNKSVIIIPVLILFCLSQLFSQNTVAGDKVFIKMEVKGLACPYCAFGLERELGKLSGVREVEIDLKEGLVYISTPFSQKPSKKDLKKIIANAGFTAGEIEYREQPFERLSDPIKWKKRKRKNQ